MRVEFAEHLAQVLDGEQSAAGPAVADEADRLALPLGEVPVDGRFQRGRVAAVVVGSDDDERVGRGQPGGEVEHPGRARRVRLQRGRHRGQRERQIGLGEVDHVDLESAVRGGLVGEPGGDRRREAPLPDAADDHREFQ